MDLTGDMEWDTKLPAKRSLSILCCELGSISSRRPSLPTDHARDIGSSLLTVATGSTDKSNLVDAPETIRKVWHEGSETTPSEHWEANIVDTETLARYTDRDGASPLCIAQMVKSA